MWLIILLFISVAFIIFTTSKLKWHPFFSLLITAFGFGGFSGTMTLEEVVKSINSGFGNTIGFIGIVILAGSIIGKFLEKSGGAYTLAGSTLKIVGIFLSFLLPEKLTREMISASGWMGEAIIGAATMLNSVKNT